MKGIDEKRELLLLRWLKQEERDFDRKTGLLQKPFSSPGYHTKFKGAVVHQTRENMMYASALLDSGIPAYVSRGKEIALKIAALQDQDESSPTFGIWSWFYEEPLSQMSPPDWNWADFLGKEFLYLAMKHKAVFDEDEYQRIKTAVCFACRSIIRRAAPPDYTNISLMGTYVTYIAGEYFQHEEFLAYGKKRLQSVLEFNQAYGNFAEYNSPSYTLTAAEDLGRFYRDIRSQEGKKQVYALLRIAWRTILLHFHEPTGQWSGPHGRCYSAFLSKQAQAELQYATGGRLCFMDEKELENELLPEVFRTGICCFQEFLDEFCRSEEPCFSQELYQRYGELCRASLYQCRGFSLGSFYKNEMWIQRDNIIGYFGTRKQPVMMKLQCLHDFYDFSAGQLYSVQKDGTIASIMNFAVDGGDRHPSLDPLKEGAVEAEDIRIRLKFTGGLEQIREYGQKSRTRFYFRGDGVSGLFDVPYAAFGPWEPAYEINHVKKEEAAAAGSNTNIDHMDGLAFDVILYHGERRKIRLNQLENAVCAMVLRINETGVFSETLRHFRENGRLTLEVREQDGVQIKVSAAVKPGKKEEAKHG